MAFPIFPILLLGAAAAVAVAASGGGLPRNAQLVRTMDEVFRANAKEAPRMVGVGYRTPSPEFLAALGNVARLYPAVEFFGYLEGGPLPGRVDGQCGPDSELAVEGLLDEAKIVHSQCVSLGASQQAMEQAIAAAAAAVSK